jgi:dihydrofolate reductase
VVSGSPVADLPADVTWAPTPVAALDEALATDPAPAVAGGAALYRALLDQVVRIDRTRIDVAVPDADTWFPPLDPTTWQLVASRPGDDPRLTFEILDRTARPGPTDPRI